MPGVAELYGLLAEYLDGLGLMLSPAQLASGGYQLLASIAWIEAGPDLQPAALAGVHPPEERRVVMLHRQKEPYAGLWTAPGGKLELGETPVAAFIREMGEETGLIMRNFQLRLITSECGSPGYDWITFVYRCDRWEGVLDTGWHPEGRMEWVRLADLPRRAIPDVDRQLLFYIFPELASYFEEAGLCPDPQARREREAVPPAVDQIYLAQVQYAAGGRTVGVRIRPVARR
ncbi:MAG: NUDIX domain-containing protein [Limnochordales bacterium]|nr:NUDIX domain-containing protein [Limnochordales bacterium]